MGRRKTQGIKRDVNAAVRAASAIDLFLQGHTYESIAAQAGYASRGAAYNAIQRELSRTIAPKAEQACLIEILRMQKLLVALMPRAIGKDDQNANWASGRVLAISDHLAKLQNAYPSPAKDLAQPPTIVYRHTNFDPEEV